MEEKSNKFKELIRAVKFTLISISAGIIQFGSFSLLFYLFGISESISNAISIVLSVVWNFTINRKFTFKSANNIKIAMLLVAIFYAVFLPLSSWFHYFGASVGMDALIVEIIVLLSNFVLEFLYTRFVVYRNSCDTAKKIERKSEPSETENTDKE